MGVGRTGCEKRLDVEYGDRGASDVGEAGSAMPMRLAAALSRSMAILARKRGKCQLDGVGPTFFSCG